MPLMNQAIIDRLLVSASEMLARSGDGDNHTVAASLYADDGSIYSGMNLYHFTGGLARRLLHWPGWYPKATRQSRWRL